MYHASNGVGESPPGLEPGKFRNRTAVTYPLVYGDEMRRAGVEPALLSRPLRRRGPFRSASGARAYEDDSFLA